MLINLDNLVELHDNENAIHRHKRILEELFYLCINETFVETVAEARISIQQMLHDIDLDFPCERITALQIRNGQLADSDDYKLLLDSISHKHKYHHPAFTKNYRKIGRDTETHNEFNVLENIIFFNNPLPEANPLDYFNNRSGFMEIIDDEIIGPHIRIQFDIGTTKGEMLRIIEKDFTDTAGLLSLEYNVPKTRYRADENLTVKTFIHRRSYFEESDMDIAMRLEKAGLLSSEVTQDHVKKYRQRMKADTSRFQRED